jgi:hypothetical protein
MLSSIDSPTQGSLRLKVIREYETVVGIDIIKKRTDLRAAVRLACEASGLDDKVICLELDIDPGQWARIKSGKAHFPDEKYNDLLDLLGNEIPLEWWANSRGYKLVKIRSRLEDELEEERQRTAELEMKIALLKEIATGKV